MNNPLNVWVVCAHPPSADPRIGWSADLARSYGDNVRIFGLSHLAEVDVETLGVDSSVETIFGLAGKTRRGWPATLRSLWKIGLRPSILDRVWIILTFLVLSPLLIFLALIFGILFLLTALGRFVVRALKFILRRFARMACHASLGVSAGLRRLPKGEAIDNLMRHGLRVLRNQVFQPKRSRPQKSLSVKTGAVAQKNESEIGLLKGSISVPQTPISSGWRLSFKDPFSLPRRMLRVITKGRLGNLLIALDGYRWYFGDHALPLAERVVLAAEMASDAPDIIHAHDPDALLTGLALKLKFGGRLVYDAHEYGPDAYLIHPKPRLLFRMWERALFGKVDAAVTVSPQLAERFKGRRDIPCSFDVVPNASPLTAGDVPKGPFDARVSAVAQDRLRVAFQGGFAPERGIGRVLEEWVGINNAALFLRGPLGERRDVLIARARELGLLGESVFFLDSVDESDLVAAAADMDVGLIPYASEIENHMVACPNKLSQYMLAGVALLATPLPFVRTMVEISKGGRIYNDQTPGELARVVNEMAKGRRETIAMGRRARSHALHEYHYEAFAQILEIAYARDRATTFVNSAHTQGTQPAILSENS